MRAVQGWFSRLIPAGFYYKTFMASPPAWHFFENVQIPKQVAKVGEKAGFGTSQLTARGVQNVDDTDQPDAPAPGGGRRPVPRGPRRGR